VSDEGTKDVTWLRPDGEEMTPDDWRQPDCHVLGMLVDGEASDEVDERGRLNRGETLLLLLNGGTTPTQFELPDLPEAGRWSEVVNTACIEPGAVTMNGIRLAEHSLILLRREVQR